jgi:hypothetical protein
VERCGAGGGGRRAARRALMAFGRVRVSRSGVRAARPAQGDGTARAGVGGGSGEHREVAAAAWGSACKAVLLLGDGRRSKRTCEAHLGR